MIKLTLDLIFDIGLLIFSIFCYIYIGATTPGSGINELGAAFWPQLILSIMMILLVVNIRNTIKKNKEEKKTAFTTGNIQEFFKSKLFIGMIFVILMALLLETLGFLLTTFLFITAYCWLLGERRIHIMILVGIISTIILYLIFSVGLQIMLPRGIGFLRNFALMIENLLTF